MGRYSRWHLTVVTPFDGRQYAKKATFDVLETREEQKSEKLEKSKKSRSLKSHEVKEVEEAEEAFKISRFQDFKIQDLYIPIITSSYKFEKMKNTKSML